MTGNGWRGLAWVAWAACLALVTASAAPGAVAATAPRTVTAERAPAMGGAALGSRGTVVHYPSAGAPRLPVVPASAWVIADAGTGQVLAAKDPHGTFGPASTLKVLTAITLMPVLKPGATVVASRQAADVTPAKVGLIAGQRYPVSSLFQALLMISANDAAIALADATGSYGKAIAMMNAEARHLRASDTVAKTPNGLTSAGQYSSAYDEALIARQALKTPEFMHDIGLRITTFPLTPHDRVTLWAQNSMLSTYPGDLGGKIGWTSASGATYTGWARRGGHTLIVTLLHCPALTETASAAALLNWGFAMDGTVRPVGTLVSPLPAPPAQRHPRRPGNAREARSAQVPFTLGVVLAVMLAVSGPSVIDARRRGDGLPAQDLVPAGRGDPEL